MEIDIRNVNRHDTLGNPTTKMAVTGNMPVGYP